MSISPKASAREVGSAAVLTTGDIRFAQTPTASGARSPRVQAAPNVSSINVGSDPRYATYDSENGFVYVVNTQSANVSVVNGTALVATVDVANEPASPAFDDRNGYVYVPNEGNSSVAVIDGTKVVAWVAGGNSPQFATFDPSNGYVYVANSGLNTVSVINGTKVIATVKGGFTPQSPTYASGNGYVYVPNQSSNNVTIINGTNFVGAVRVGSFPDSATYDPADGDVYVSNDASQNVSLINGTNPAGVVAVPETPGDATYDSGSGEVYVSTWETVSVLKGSKVVGSVHVGLGAQSATYDGRNGCVYVPNSVTDNMSVVDGLNVVGTVPVGTEPRQAIYDGGNGFVYVPNVGSDNVSAFFTGATVEFTETGLPTGTGWWVNVSGGPSTYSVTTNLSFGALDGLYDYSVASTDKTYSSPGGSFSIAGAAVSAAVAIAFSRVTYPVTFTEEGLPGGTNWSVTLGGTSLATTTSAIVFSEPNGSIPYSVGPLAGWTIPSYVGSVLVDGSAVAQNVSWTRATYLVTFVEVGLVGEGWWVNVTRGTSTFSSSTGLSFVEPNGTYSYSVSAVTKTYAAAGGSFGVNGAPVLERVAFSLLTFTVAFTESGLPPGTSWSVAIDTTQHTSATSTIRFTEPNGTYPFALAPVPGYVGGPSPGTVAVEGANVTQSVAFTAAPPATYTVTFSETGLPSGTIWSVTFDTIPESGTGTLSYPGTSNGTYSFTVAPVAGFVATPSSGSIAVNGPPASQSIAFRSSAGTGGNGSSTFLGLPTPEGYGVLGGVIIALLVATVAVALLRKRGGGPAPEPAKPDTGVPPSSP
jgi:YVTN family beta-propeller protein